MEKEFLEAYEAHADAIFRYCLVRVYERERARDLVQDVFVKAWNYIRSGHSVEKWKPFLFRIATNLIIDGARKKKEIVSLDIMQESGFDFGKDDRKHIDNWLDGQKAIDALGKLEDAYRDAVYMRYVEDLSPKEIAAISGVSENLISVRIHRGLYKLKKLLKR
ncbi:MAG: hypothetical protein A3C85_03655 [Candidatus Doudnabacteria bacterium RIFCSPHIGHO2_02_FULL_48_21]|uniref:RNA polymerase sigma factor n=1 Tax=Candidatus Doudnabacteria bacterium RIFCSPLOWO2_02_FULL_48_13 TaxID=1817845 RepID=A0A1F5QCM4_9BACT|nr:MAG: hypothetical protein A3K05_04035 [Candidatus Doudnabacteria bacterium RIFCSPHIGHO2_01_48_18]OGE78709.1 MAG: hypothetical protein A2668_02810 [Candidatus Doudnabacteria bacterium RIFCSPHIGHO2_01_FULL_48_180]OGE91717.1 MAG: hypothetical protein A3F44_04560 [Candidatus Doudnabacteria bacterium RIFCSPHIGHO2_12_FULL_47_25]OGE93477.1 MAG: hypothetical protein A3C85_03655 [Candidatus Doudnabacteria bacterium RIFCSPHIGHO2_02_FULL_48_21]OGE97722.1 MAG: hypothetical protein A3A83_00415 [Candidatu